MSLLCSALFWFELLLQSFPIYVFTLQVIEEEVRAKCLRLLKHAQWEWPENPNRLFVAHATQGYVSSQCRGILADAQVHDGLLQRLPLRSVRCHGECW